MRLYLLAYGIERSRRELLDRNFPKVIDKTAQRVGA
jgi:hypothetical protein